MVESHVSATLGCLGPEATGATHGPSVLAVLAPRA